MKNVFEVTEMSHDGKTKSATQHNSKSLCRSGAGGAVRNEHRDMHAYAVHL